MEETLRRRLIEALAAVSFGIGYIVRIIFGVDV